MKRLHLAFVSAMVVPALLFVGAAWFDRNRILSQETANARSTVDILRELTLQALDTDEQLIEEVDRRIQGMTWAEIRANHDRLATDIRAMIANHPQVSRITLLDEAGIERVATTPAGAPQPPTGIDVGQREKFAADRDVDQDHATVAIDAQDENFVVSRRLTTKDGSFDGTIKIVMPMAYLTDFWERAMQDRPGARISLIRSDGEILANSPKPEQAERHVTQPYSPLLEHLALQPEGNVYLAMSPVEGVRCLFASAKVGTTKLIVVYGRTLSGVLDTWHQGLVILGGICASAAAALAGSVHLAISQARRLDEERTRRTAAEQTAIAAQRLEVLGQLAAGVAHDFGNVVQAVEMGAMVIAASMADERTQRTARMIGEAAKQGRWLTQRMLDFSRGDIEPSDDGTERVVHPAEAVAGISKLLSITLGHGYRVRYEAKLDGLPALVRGDDRALEGAIMNLAINARDAMPDGGEVVIRLEPDWVPRHGGGATCPTGLAPGRYARVSIADTGGGMPPEVLARASEPFFSTKPRGQGTGLGLAAARGFAQRVGGGFHIASTEGVGTTVSLWLVPVVAEQADRRHPCVEETPAF
ncbi:MAG: ATP-binding protein [Rhodopila sp.]